MRAAGLPPSLRSGMVISHLYESGAGATSDWETDALWQMVEVELRAAQAPYCVMGPALRYRAHHDDQEISRFSASRAPAEVTATYAAIVAAPKSTVRGVDPRTRDIPAWPGR